ncbi:DUF2293 domain-containing protein [Ancylobacter terrae]|uniref:DUF2293 domain-containing protein n=1 Tax=Ancylobacter sp. sgz301288 TaxID=3342077 RepID=UPI00385BA112
MASPQDTESDPLTNPEPEPSAPSPVPAKRRTSQWFFRIEPTPEERERFLRQLSVYIAAMYPGCPHRWRRRLVRRARERGHYGRLGEIAGVLVTSSIRHEATDYDRLLRINGPGDGLTREEARLVVEAEVADTVADWRRRSAEHDGGYIAVRRQFRRAWRKGRKKPRPGLTAVENAALAEYLAEWLKRPPEGPPAPEHMTFGGEAWRVLRDP